MERTLILLKPDSVKRALTGEILGRFEKAGLKIVGLKMVWVTKDHAAKHYTSNEEFLVGMGNKTLKTYEEYGKDPHEELGTKDPLEIGKMVRAWNLEFLSSGPVVAVVLEGNHAVTSVRKIVGATLPVFSEPGSIRGTYSVDSPVLANARKRAVRNMIHASGTVEEAKSEIELWFHKDEIYDYHRADEDVMF
jgi:nucleoside-diphosphate kinase